MSKLFHFKALYDYPHPKSLSLRIKKGCPNCGSKKIYHVYVNPSESSEKMAICEICNYSRFGKGKLLACGSPSLQPFRALQWPLFCEFNGIGDLYHDVIFENIQQTSQKIDVLKKFALHPSHILCLVGDKGTGKTFASLGICELFTRAHTDCIFLSQRKLISSWIEAQKGMTLNGFIDKLKSITLLVIDDFGKIEPSPGFMAFFFDLIDSRLQWRKKGTILTSNLSQDDFGEICGDALTDRIFSGQLLKFAGNSRRKQKKL